MRTCRAEPRLLYALISTICAKPQTVLYNVIYMVAITPGNPFQAGQQEDQRYVGGMMLEKTYRR